MDIRDIIRQLQEAENMSNNAKRYHREGDWRQMRYCLRLANQAMKAAHNTSQEGSESN